MSMLDSHEHVGNEHGGAAAEESSAKVAVICFPLVILVGGGDRISFPGNVCRF